LCVWLVFLHYKRSVMGAKKVDHPPPMYTTPMQWPNAILISCHPTLAVPGCLKYHAVLGAIK